MEAGIRRLLLLAGAIVFVDTVFFAAVVPILPGLVEELGLSKSGAGVLIGAYAAGTLLASLPAGWLAMRIGVRPTAIGGLALLAGSSLVFAFAEEAWILDLARFAQGVGSAASWAGALSWLIGAAPAERRGELIGSAMAAATAGALFGPAVGGAAEAAGRGPVFAASALVAAGLMAAALRVPPPVTEPPTAAGSLRAALGDGRVAAGFWLVLLPGVTLGVIDVLVPLRLDVLGAGAAAIAAVFLAAAALETVVTPIAGRISDRVGRILPSLVALGTTAVLVALLPLPESAWLLGALVIALGPSIGAFWAPAMALLSDAAEARGVHQAFAFGLTNLAWASGALLGSAGGASLGEEAGDAAAYLTVSVLCLLTLVALLRRSRGRRSRSPRRRSPI